MNFQQIIDHYYVPGKLRDILMVHSRKVADKAIKTCNKPEMIPFIEAAAMLHDIGIIRCDAAGIECYGTEPYICHGRIGAQMLREDVHLFGLSQKEIEIVAYRFGLYDGKTLTLEEIGKMYGITRERVRQIESRAIRRLRLDAKIKSYCPDDVKLSNSSRGSYSSYNYKRDLKEYTHIL